MGEILKGATIFDLNPPNVERADLRIVEGRIAARGPDIAQEPGDEVTELHGRYVMPGLVVAHSHLYSSLARGMPPPATPPRNFREILENVWWKLDRALDESMIELSGQVGAAEALLCGVTTVVDHHASPSHVDGSLSALRRGIDRMGLRSLLCYEVSDRNGVEGRRAGLEETERFLETGQTSRCRAMVGGHASFTLEQETLEAMADLAHRFGVGIHIHLAESADDERDSQQRFDKGVVARLVESGAVTSRTVLAHCTQLSWEELVALQETGAWLVHNPRSNMNNAVGFAPSGRFGARKALGTDGIGADILAEVQVACLRASEAGVPSDPLRWLAGGQSLVGEAFGMTIGPLAPGAAADLVVLDYPSPTPVTPENLASHVLYGLNAGHVDAVMVEGLWRVWFRQILSADYQTVRNQAQVAARRLWNRMREM